MSQIQEKTLPYGLVEMSAGENSVRHLELLAALDDFQENELEPGLIDRDTVRVCLNLLTAAVNASEHETAEAAAVHAENMDALHQRADEGDAEQPR